MTSSLHTVFDAMSSGIDEVLWTNPSAKVFVLDINSIHHKDWLIYCGGTDRPGESCYNLSIAKSCTQMINFPPQIPGCDSCSSSFLHLFFLLMKVFVLQWFSLCLEILIMLSQFSLTFLQTQSRMLLLLADLLVVLGKLEYFLWPCQKYFMGVYLWSGYFY